MKAQRTRPKLSLDELLHDPKAKKAFDLLIRHNSSPEQLLLLIQIAVDAHFLPSSYDMLFVDGMTRAEVAAFPNQLNRVARTIELVNESVHLEESSKLPFRVEGLTIHLWQYARFLKRTIEFTREFMEKNPRYWHFKSIFVLKLLRYVHKTTGRPRYSAIADLMNAALTEAGLDEFIDPNSLRKLYTRNTVNQKPQLGNE